MEQKWTELKRETEKSKMTAGDFNTPLSNQQNWETESQQGYRTERYQLTVSN